MAKAKSQVYEFDVALSGKVDEQNGIVRGVSLITGGIKARGHDLEVDDTTLSQVLQLAEDAGQVPVKWNHKTGADAVNGFVCDPYLDGNKVKADWHLLQTHSQYKQALELAKRMPAQIGLSVAFLGKEAVVGGVKKARCEELISVDLVAQPAANPDGLFEARNRHAVDTRRRATLMEDPNAAAATEPTLSELRELIETQNVAINKLNEDFRASRDADQPLSDEELNELANLGDEQLAELGVSRDQVEAAISAREGDPNGGDPNGGDPNGGDPNGGGVGAEQVQPAEVLAEVKNLRNRVVYMERKEKAEEAAAEKQALDHAFEVIESKVVELAAENDALRHQLGSRAGGPVSHGTELTFFNRGGGNGSNGNMTAFEVRVEELQAQPGADGKPVRLTQAIQLAMKEDRGRYIKHLEAKGVGLKHL